MDLWHQAFKLKTALAVSGGLDSYLAYRLAEINNMEVDATYFPLGHPYQQQEIDALNNLGVRYQTVELSLIQPKFRNVPTPEDQVIPARNLIFAVLLASLGYEVIWIIALDGEMHPYMRDKNQYFFDQASQLLTYTVDQDVIVGTPFPNYTKAEIVEIALFEGVTPDEILLTRTCYAETVKHCGSCSACVKRAIALFLNDIEQEWETKPFESAWWTNYVTTVQACIDNRSFTHYSEKRCMEAITVREALSK